MNVVIMGCGRVGSRIASNLDLNGHTVAVIDLVQSSFRRLPTEFSGKTVLGTGIDEDVLRAAGIESADSFIAVSNSDNPNIMAA